MLRRSEAWRLAQSRERSIHSSKPAGVVANEMAIEDCSHVSLPMQRKVTGDGAVPPPARQVVESLLLQSGRICEDIYFENVTPVAQRRHARPPRFHRELDALGGERAPRVGGFERHLVVGERA